MVDSKIGLWHVGQLAMAGKMYIVVSGRPVMESRSRSNLQVWACLQQLLQPLILDSAKKNDSAETATTDVVMAGSVSQP